MHPHCYRIRLLSIIAATLIGVFVMPSRGSADSLDPFFPGTNMQGYSEIALFWNNVPGATPHTSGKLYDLQEGLPPDTANLLSFPRQNAPALPGVAGERDMITAVGDLNGDKISDPIVAWSGPGDSIHIMIPQIVDNSYTWSQSSMTSIPGDSTRILLNVGNFDDDRQDEFAVTFGGTDGRIHTDIFDTDSSFAPRLVQDIISDSLFTMPEFFRNFPDPDNPPASPGFAATYAVACGDFEGNHMGELLLLTSHPGANGRWTISGSLYRNPMTDAQPVLRKDVHTALPTNYVNDSARVVGLELVAAAGNLDGTFGDEAAMALHVAQIRSTNPTRYYDSTIVGIIQVTSGPDDLIVSPLAKRDWGNVDGDLSVALGDLNADGKAEIAVLYGPKLQIFESDSLTPTLKLEQTAVQTSTRFFTSYQSVAISDMDADLKSEIVVVDNLWDPSADSPVQSFNIQVYNTTVALDSIYLKCHISQDEQQSASSNYNTGRRFAVAMGDFNGDRLRLGPPTYTIDHDISQPLVILNSPPIHFDVLGGQNYDVSGCFNGQTCGFSSTYEKSTTTEVQVTTEVNADWSMNLSLTQELSAGVSTPEAKIAASLEQNQTLKYGGKFSRVRNSTKTVNISVKVQATSSDQIYGIVSDYEVWEYPVYDDTGKVGHIVVVRPTVKESRWFPGSSWTGFSYVPNHEVGNILSYSDYNGLSHIDYLDEPIKVNVGDGFTLGPTTSFEWSLQYDDFSSQSASVTHSFGIGLGLKAEASAEVGFKYAGLGFTVGGKVSDNYTTETNASLVSTLSTTVRQTLSVKADLGSVSSGDDKAYEVIPYAYWGKTGALVLDFAARPQVAPPGFPITWWQQQYGAKPDPAFLLPFLYYPQKGLDLVDPEKRFLTNEILLEPEHPVVGDTVTITARLHNLSLQPITQPLTLRFYVGNPATGGTLITPVGQSPNVVTDSNFVAARGQAIVECKWIMTPDVPRYAHIYAQVDPDNVLDEIHEDNNIGFAVLGNPVGSDPTDVNDNSGHSLLATSFTLSQNYPNPFNPSTTIAYTVPKAAKVQLTVYNVLGQEVRTLLNETEPAGDHTVVWDGRSLSGNPVASGVYFYRLSTDQYAESKKMLLLK